jgi:DNA-binding SARP family transcriptional activator
MDQRGVTTVPRPTQDRRDDAAAGRLRQAAQQLAFAGQYESALRRLVQAGDRAAATTLLAGRRDLLADHGAHRGGRSPGAGWRPGLRSWLAGQRHDAVAAYERAGADQDDPAEAAHAHSLAVAWYLDLADPQRAGAAVARAFGAAERTGDQAGLAGAYRAAALLAAASGDRAAGGAHDDASRTLDPAGDTELMSLMLHLNLAAHALDHRRPADVLADVEAAVLAGRRGRHLGFEPFALGLGAAAKVRLGHLEEALADVAAAHRLRQVLGTESDVAFQLAVLGQVHGRRREARQAREALEAALAAGADESAYAETLAALARVRAADDPPLARDLADRAVALGMDDARVPALLARGWVALVAGDHERAAADAAEARTAARGLRHDVELAEALELMVLANPAPKPAAGLLDDATDLRRAIGDVPGEAQVRLVAARLRGDRTAVENAEERLRRCGVRLDPGIADAVTALATGAPPVSIWTLGEFRVCRSGTAVAPGEWQSKKARDLLKMLIAHRGRPVPRQRLVEQLWPDQPPARTGNRLSVLLTILRRVLDPQRRIAYPGPIVADRASVCLDLHAVDVDIERFLAAVSAAQDSCAEGSPDGAVRLRAAAQLYKGDFLADDPYEDWAQPLRDEVAAAYVTVLRALAAQSPDTDEKARYLLRIIHRDPYDEQAHLGLVRALEQAGRHGEARRRYQAYAERMAELGIDPAPDRRAER